MPLVKLSAFSIATLVFFALGCAEKTATQNAQPSPAVVEAAIVSLKSAHRDARANAGLLLKDAAKLGESCERVGKIVADSGSGWSFAAALWSKSDTCKAEFDKLVDRIVAEAKLQEKIFSEDSVNGFNGYDMDYLDLFVKNPALTSEQKKENGYRGKTTDERGARSWLYSMGREDLERLEIGSTRAGYARVSHQSQALIGDLPAHDFYPTHH